MESILDSATPASEQLAAILAYRNEDVLSRFLDLYAVDAAEAEALFLETRRFLWLSQFDGVFIPDELLILDEMWHNFALFTRAYQEFCFRYFGAFNHHNPATAAEKEARRREVLADPEGARRRHGQRMQVLMSLAWDKLGPETFGLWFEQYPVRYTPDRIKALRR